MNVADLALLVTLRAVAAKPVIPQFPVPAVRKVIGYAPSRVASFPLESQGRRRESARTASELRFSPDDKHVDASAGKNRLLSGVDWSASPLVVQDILDPTIPSPAPDSARRTVVSPSHTLITSPSSDFLSELQSQWLSALYREGFEAVFGSWMGRYSNPFVFGQDSFVEKYVSISDLCCQLDRWMAESSDGQNLGQQESETDRQIQQSLRSTIASYSARWLDLTAQPAPSGCAHLDVTQALWRDARRDMLKAINRPSYRSMISLFLFALTPIPYGISEEEEADGISGQPCVQAALQQIQTLRARQRNLQFSESKVSPSSPMKVQAICKTPESIGTSSFINAESTAYWAALTFDTSASLTLNCRSLLSSGLFGFEAELPWRLVRTTSKMFDETVKHWGLSSFEMTDERANQIIAAGASWKLLGWKLTAIFKEALRDGHDELEVQKGYAAVVDSVKHFNTIYRPRLDACQKRMQFLGQKTKLRWYTLMLHHHLSILMFVDFIDAANRYDLLASFAEESTDAETTVMNTLAFGLHNTYTLSPLPDSTSNHPSPSVPSGNATAITVPLVSIDPYSHHVVAGVALMRKAIDRNYGVGKIAKEPYRNLLSTLERILSLLPQCSKSVQAVTTKFSSKAPDEELSNRQDLSDISRKDNGA
ncbi:unnamed protein product [Clonostachys chloroleuca]|uniref:Uncharacterized protein n=1 Tax=Clonostachys chloroleuca TaxID=1926264 RepID=A0AA35VES1_9HYPO|nr:unnamed protein product [Clonostachys chloroleuca]